MSLNIKYFLKNILNSPIEGFKEFNEDYKKDNKYKNLDNKKKKYGYVGYQNQALH